MKKLQIMLMTLYAVSNNIDDLIWSLEKSSKVLLKLFDVNLMESNRDKCHLLVSSCEKKKNGNREFPNRKKYMWITFRSPFWQ